MHRGRGRHGREVRRRSTLVHGGRRRVRLSVTSRERGASRLLTAVSGSLLRRLSKGKISARHVATLHGRITHARRRLIFVSRRHHLICSCRGSGERFFSQVSRFEGRGRLTRGRLRNRGRGFHLGRRRLGLGMAKLGGRLTRAGAHLGRLSRSVQRARGFGALGVYPPILRAKIRARGTGHYGGIVRRLARGRCQRVRRRGSFERTINQFSNGFSRRGAFGFHAQLAGQRRFVAFTTSLGRFVSGSGVVSFRHHSGRTCASLVRQVKGRAASVLSGRKLVHGAVDSVGDSFIRHGFTKIVGDVTLRVIPDNGHVVRRFIAVGRFYSQGRPNNPNVFDLFKRRSFMRQGQRTMDLLRSLIGRLTLGGRGRLALSSAFRLRFHVIRGSGSDK